MVIRIKVCPVLQGAKLPKLPQKVPPPLERRRHLDLVNIPAATFWKVSWEHTVYLRAVTYQTLLTHLRL